MKCQGRTNFYPPICDRDATVERDGKVFCWQHDPELLRKQARDRNELRKAQDAKREKEWCRMDLERSAGLRPDQIAELTDEQVRWIAEAGGILAFVTDDRPPSRR